MKWNYLHEIIISQNKEIVAVNTIPYHHIHDYHSNYNVLVMANFCCSYC